MSASRRSRISSALVLALAVAPVCALLSGSARGATDTWTGATDTNWSTAGNWTGGNAPPQADDSLIFSSSPITTTSDDIPLAALPINGLAFDATAPAYTLNGPNGIQITGALAGNSNGVTNNSANAQVLNLSVALDWGCYTFGNTISTGSIALNGAITATTGSIATFVTDTGTITSTSLQQDVNTGLIAGWNGAALVTNSAGLFTGLATVSGGTITAYTYSDPHAQVANATGALNSDVYSNVQLNATATGTTTFTFTGTGSIYLNTITNVSSSGGTAGTNILANVNPAGGQTLVLGKIGGVYATEGGLANTVSNANLLQIGGSGALSAGGNTAGPGTLIIGVNGGTTNNQIAITDSGGIVDNPLGGAVTVVKTGDGSAYIKNASKYTGGTYIEQGYLQGNVGTAFGTGPVYVAGGATVYPNSGGATFANNFVLSPGLGAFSHYGAMRIDATGMIFSGSATSPALTLSGDPVVAGVAAGDRITNNSNNSTTTITGQITGTGTLEVTAATATATTVLTNTSANANNWTGGLLIDNTSGNFSWVKLGANNQIPVVDTVSLAAGNAFGNVSSSGTAQFDLNGHSNTIAGLISTTGATNIVTNSAAVAGTLTIGGSGSYAYSGVMSDTAATPLAVVVALGAGGVQNFSGSSTAWSGGLTVQSGTLQVGSDSALGVGNVAVNGGIVDLNNNSPTIGSLSGTSGTVTNSGSSPVTLTVGGAENSTYAGVINDGTAGGQTSLIVQGTGALTLAGASAFTGSTTINSGSLIVTGNLTSSPAITIANNGTLGGTGTAGNVTLNSYSGVIDPGTGHNTIGALTLSSLTATSGTLQFDIGGTQADQLIVTGNASISGATFNVALLPAMSMAPGTYTLLSSTQPLSLSGDTFDTPLGTRQLFTVTQNPDNIQLTVGVGSPATLTWNATASGAAWDVTTSNNWTATSTVSNGSPNQFYQLDNVTFDDSNGSTHTVQLVNPSTGGPLTPTSVTVNTSSTYSFQGGGSIGGTTSLVIQGGGTLSLANTGGNSYTGGTDIQNGTLQVASSNALPATTVVTFGDAGNHSGTLDLDGNPVTVAGLATVGSGTANTIGNSYSFSAATLVVSGGNSTFYGVIQDTLLGSTGSTTALNVTGNASLILAGNNTYSGSTNIDSGSTLQLGAGGTSGGINSASSLNNNGALIFNRSDSITFGNAINGSGTVAINSGTVTFTNYNSYSGTTTINPGATLQVGDGGTVGSGTLIDNGTFGFNVSSPLAFSTVITGAGGLGDVGVGVVSLSGANTFTGNTTISPGATLQLTTSASLGATTGGSVTVLSGGTLDVGGDITANNLNLGTKQIFIAGAGVGGAGAIINSASNNAGTFTGDIPQDDAFENIILTANATFGGTSRWDMRNGTPILNLQNFTLSKVGSNQISLVNVTLENGTGGIDVQTGSISIETGSNTLGTGTITYEQGTTAAFYENTGNVIWNMVLQGGNLVGNGGGTTATIAAPMTMNGNITIEPISSSVPAPAANNPLVLTGNITDNNGGFSVTEAGDTTLTLSGSNTWTGDTVIQNGTLKLGSNAALPANTSLTFSDGTNIGTLDLGGFNASVSSLAIVAGSGSGVIGNSGASASTLTFAGNGTPSTFGGTIQDVVGTGSSTTALVVSGGSLALSGANTYSGGTTVNGGTLLASNTSGSATGSGTVTLNGGTLGGNGVITGAVLAGTGPHTIHPGATGTPGTLTIGGLTTNTATTLAFDLDSPTASDNSVLAINGDVSLNGGTLAVTSQTTTGAASLGYYKVISYTGALTGSTSGIVLPAVANNIAYTLDTTQDAGYIDIHRGYIGDANDDGTVDLNDLNTVLNNLGTTNSSWSAGNFDGAATIDLNDLNDVLNHLGTTVASGAGEITQGIVAPAIPSAPEPATLSLAAIGAAALLIRRKRH